MPKWLSRPSLSLLGVPLVVATLAFPTPPQVPFAMAAAAQVTAEGQVTSAWLSSLVPGTVSEVFEGELQHMVYVPKSWTADSGSYPTILFMHGAGGTAKPEKVQSISLVKMLIDDAIPSNADAGEFPFVVVIPVARTSGWQNQFGEVSALFERVKKDLAADETRLYLAGQSMGGHGAYEFASANPSLFAAVVPICGFVNRNKSRDSSELAKVASALAAVPTWAFHSADDAMVSVEHTDAIVEALREAGNGNVKYTRYETAPGLPGFGPKGQGHASYELAFMEGELYEWLLQQSRA